MTNRSSIEETRAQLAILRARYGHEPPPKIVPVVRRLETQLAWHEHRHGRASVEECDAR